jgi:hypothetical protein
MPTPTTPTAEQTTTMIPLGAPFTTTPPVQTTNTTPSPLRNLSTAQLLLLKQFYLRKYLEVSEFIDFNLAAH